MSAGGASPPPPARPPDADGHPLIEAYHRIAAYLFDTDPAAEHRGSMRSNIVRLSGASSLLAPYCVRGATGVEVA